MVSSPAPPSRPPADARPPHERRHPLPLSLRIGVLVGVLVGAVLGFLIVFSVMRITCGVHLCTGLKPVLWGVGGGVVGLVGTAVVAVLVARSFGEWRMLREERRTDGTDADAAPEA